MIKTFSDKEHEYEEGFEISIEKVEPSKEYPSGFTIKICDTYDTTYVYGKNTLSMDVFDLLEQVCYAIINYDKIQNNKEEEDE